MIKTPKESYTEQVHILTQNDINGRGRLFGGRLMEWIDMVAGVVARRHSNCDITTALVDTLDFKAPALANDLVVLLGKIVYAGTSSMVISVKSCVEHLDGSRKLINSAYVTLVALDENDMPCRVPRLELQTEDEKREYRQVKARVEERKRLREQNKE